VNLPDNTNPPERPRRLQPPAPRPYHMTDAFLDRGLWCFWLAADQEVLEYVSNLHCILQPPPTPFQRRLQGRVLFAINPRYDHHEAWAWVKQTLDEETSIVELNDRWESALMEAQHNAQSDDTSPTDNS
jgi:hypothetical protein